MIKILRFILIIFLMMPLSTLAQTYTVPDYNLKIDFNDEWDVFTEDNLVGNENLQKYNITYDYLSSFMTTNFVYLDAVKENGLEMVIRVSQEPSKINNLSNYSDSDLKNMGKDLIEKTGAIDYSTFKSNGITYVKSSYYDNKVKVYLLEYITVANGNSITFTLQSYSGFAEKTLENEIDQIIKSAVIEIDPSKMDENINKGINWRSVFETGLTGALVGGGLGLFKLIADRKKKKSDNTLNRVIKQ